MQASERDIKLAIKTKYSKAARIQRLSCCNTTDPEGIPESAKQVALGCGSPVRYANLAQGMIVLDLGSGGGIDVFAAAKRLQGTGKVIGIDSTIEMILRARAAAIRNNYSNVEFRLGEIENLPVENETVDVAISNCVINLVPNKTKAFEEIFRVLKLEGWLTISDIVALEPLPDRIRRDVAMWPECIAGAVTKDELIRIMNYAGFKDFRVLDETIHKDVKGARLASLTFSAWKSRVCR